MDNNLSVIRELRKKRNLSMKELGASIGVAESTISLYENGKRQPDYDTLIKISNFFHVSVDFLLGNEPSKEPILDEHAISETLSEKEQKIITAYRNNPNMQPAVDRLLDLPSDDAKTAAYIAARGQNAGGATVQLNKEEIEKLRSVKESDEDF